MAQRYSDFWNLTLKLAEEKAMVLDSILDTGIRTTRVQVTVTYIDDNGAYWSAERTIKMRLKRDV